MGLALVELSISLTNRQNTKVDYMLKAIEFEILRAVKASGLVKIPLPRQPVRVATLLDEDAFKRDQFLIHNRTVFLEDRIHDWDWREGALRYYTRVADCADVLVVYQIADEEQSVRFGSKTGKPLAPLVEPKS